LHDLRRVHAVGAGRGVGKGGQEAVGLGAHGAVEQADHVAHGGFLVVHGRLGIGLQHAQARLRVRQGKHAEHRHQGDQANRGQPGTETGRGL
jgi:hypothetical protein